MKTTWSSPDHSSSLITSPSILPLQPTAVHPKVHIYHKATQNAFALSPLSHNTVLTRLQRPFFKTFGQSLQLYLHPAHNPDDIPGPAVSSTEDFASCTLNVMIGEVHAFTRYLHTINPIVSHEHSRSGLATLTQTTPHPINSHSPRYAPHVLCSARRSPSMNDRPKNTIQPPGTTRA